MSLFRVFDVSSSAITAQSQRLNVVASNIANADSAAGPDGKVYRAKQVVFEAVSGDQSNSVSLGTNPTPGAGLASVRVAGVIEDPTPPRTVYDPKHPMADGQGYVTLPSVSVVDEMVNMLSASRSYQANVEVMNTAKNLLLKALTIGQ